jgi:hypothetical protein
LLGLHPLLVLLLMPNLRLDLLGRERGGGLGAGRGCLLRRERICGTASGLLLVKHPPGCLLRRGLGGGLGLLTRQGRGSPLGLAGRMHAGLSYCLFGKEGRKRLLKGATAFEECREAEKVKRALRKDT